MKPAYNQYCVWITCELFLEAFYPFAKFMAQRIIFTLLQQIFRLSFENAYEIVRLSAFKQALVKTFYACFCAEISVAWTKTYFPYFPSNVR